MLTHGVHCTLRRVGSGTGEVRSTSGITPLAGIGGPLPIWSLPAMATGDYVLSFRVEGPAGRTCQPFGIQTVCPALFTKIGVNVGALAYMIAEVVREGLIPAGAGSTPLTPGFERRTRAHPRRRGEHLATRSRAIVGTGSSPGARGAPGRRCNLPPVRGLIPASAGSTWCLRHYRARSWAHPRKRGEHSCHGRPVIPIRGSSPQARGAPSHT